MDTISVIVPVYNIEKYIKRCVESIINQTYTNLQIILVDDGSSDDSGRICDELKDIDSRIEVIHKVNGGLSDARNWGVERARGEFVAFVDGDDYIESDMYEILYDAISNANADIASCGYYEELSDRINIMCCSENTIVLNRIEAYKALFAWRYAILGCSSCNKLFNKKIFEKIKYKVGIQSEDLELLYRALNCVQSVVCVNAVKYHYVHRDASITTSPFNKKRMGVVDVSQGITDFIHQNYPQIIKQAYAYQTMWLLGIYKSIYVDDRKKEFIKEKKYIENIIKNNFKWYWRNRDIHWCDYILLCSVALHVFPLANWLLEMAIKIKNLILKAFLC